MCASRAFIHPSAHSFRIGIDHLLFVLCSGKGKLNTDNPIFLGSAKQYLALPSSFFLSSPPGLLGEQADRERSEKQEEDPLLCVRSLSFPKPTITSALVVSEIYFSINKFSLFHFCRN